MGFYMIGTSRRGILEVCTFVPHVLLLHHSWKARAFSLHREMSMLSSVIAHIT